MALLVQITPLKSYLQKQVVYSLLLQDGSQQLQFANGTGIQSPTYCKILSMLWVYQTTPNPDQEILQVVQVQRLWVIKYSKSRCFNCYEGTEASGPVSIAMGFYTTASGSSTAMMVMSTLWVEEQKQVVIILYNGSKYLLLEHTIKLMKY